MMVIIIEILIQQYKKLFFRERERKKIKHVVLNTRKERKLCAARIFNINLAMCQS